MVPGIVYIDGEFYPSSEAKISVYDHGFLYGDGLFETMRTYNSKIFRLKEHLERLYESADYIKLTIPMEVQELDEALYKTLKQNKSEKEAYIRLTVTRGVGPVGIDPTICHKPSVVIMVKEVSINPEIYLKGIDAVVLETKRNDIEATDPRLKSMNFLNNIFAKMEVKRKGATEGVMLNQRGQITEATVSNIFVVRNGSLRTPPVDSGILPGITRQFIIDISAENIKCTEETLYPEDLYDADEIFLTNSISGVIPVTLIGSCKVGTGKVGTITSEITNLYNSKTHL